MGDSRCGIRVCPPIGEHGRDQRVRRVLLTLQLGGADIPTGFMPPSPHHQRQPALPDYLRRKVAEEIYQSGRISEKTRKKVAEQLKKLGRPYVDLSFEELGGLSAKAISGSGPVYPAELQKAGIEGTVIVSFVVDVSGRVEPRSLKVVRADHPLFEQSVRDAVSGLRFAPATVLIRGEHRRDGWTIHVVTMPDPVEAPEAYFVAIVHKDDEAHEYLEPSPSTRYLTLEMSDGSGPPFLCELRNDTGHVNYGAGPAPEIGAFIEAFTERIPVA